MSLLMTHPVHGGRCAVDEADAKRSEAEGWRRLTPTPKVQVNRLPAAKMPIELITLDDLEF